VGDGDAGGPGDDRRNRLKRQRWSRGGQTGPRWTLDDNRGRVMIGRFLCWIGFHASPKRWAVYWSLGVRREMKICEREGCGWTEDRISGH
jgi:hypothetical protein